MRIEPNKLLIICLSVLCIVFLSITIFVNKSSEQKISDINNNVALDTIVSTLETSKNTYQIYEFSLYQYNKGIITINDMSKSLQSVIELYNTMIELVNKKGYSEDYSQLCELTLSYLKEQQSAYMDFKSAIDLSSNNFFETGQMKLNKSNDIILEINKLINNME